MQYYTCSDSQSALMAIRSWKAGACQVIVAEIIKKLQGSNATLYWIPGHSGIKGNEEADKLAKVAAKEEGEEPPQRDGTPWHLVRLAIKKAKATTGPPLSKKIDTGKFTRKIDAALHLGKSAMLYQQLKSTEAAILTQLRTGKTFLKEYLHKINASETAACECGLTESIPHFLFSCRRWAQQRINLRQQHRERFGDLSFALGGYSSRREGDRSIDGPIEQWKPDISMVRATIQFAMDTGRLYPNEQDATSIEADLSERRHLLIPPPAI
jgi:hypothetical protein